MRVIITGSRDWRDCDRIGFILADLPKDSVIVHGCATGADAIARSLALSLGLEVEDHWPDYASYDFAEANHLRNQEMVDAGADLVLAFPTESSRGTWDCVNRAKDAGILIKVFHADGSRTVIGPFEPKERKHPWQ